jgi:aromatic ring-opening dioxygenase catalytic subunit (LigB family)
MAKVVIGVGVPHTPFFPNIVKTEGESSSTTRLYRRVRQEFSKAAPDLIVMFTADHFINFFLNNMPTFCVGAFAQTDGPHELSRMMPQYRVSGAPGFASALVQYGIENSFDLASAEELKLDHATMVPLHFLTPEMSVPVVPIFIKALLEPLPRADRCVALGRLVRKFIDQRPENERIAIIASGSFSLEVGGPRMGLVNNQWHAFVVDCLQRAAVDKLIQNATAENMRAAGNTGGELLLWLALLGATEGAELKFIEPDGSPPEQPRDVHAYAVWRGAA